jgi:hypothetical protein
LALTGLARLLSADWSRTSDTAVQPTSYAGHVQPTSKITGPNLHVVHFFRQMLDVYKNAYGFRKQTNCLYETIVVSYRKKDRKGCEFLQITMLHFMWKSYMLLQHGPIYGRRWSLSPIERRGWSEWRKRGEHMRWICLSSTIMHIHHGKENCFFNNYVYSLR